MNNSIRNIVIFTLVTATCGFLGAYINTLERPADTMQGLGTLVWLVSPLLASLLLRWLGRDGWKDFGIGLNIRSSWKWYLAALLIIPLMSVLLIGLGVLFGAANPSGFAARGAGAFLSQVAAGFAGSMLKNIFEEFAWRGYLTPRLETLRLHPFLNALITGVIWASWHIPYYLYFLNITDLQNQSSLGITWIIIASFFSLPFQALAYGELRLISATVWPAWLLHNLANAVSFALVTGGFVILSRDFSSILLTPGTDGIAYGLLMGAIGFWLYRIRINKLQQG